MTTFNVKLAAILLVTFIFLGVGVFFVHGFQMRRNAGFFLERAEIAEKEAKDAHDKSDKQAERKAIEKEIENLRWYCRLMPDDPRSLDAMEKFGILMADNVRDSSSFSAAYSSLERVVLKDPDRDKARKKLIGLWMLANRYIDARPLIEYLLKKKPDDPEMLTLMGQCQAAMDEHKKAKASFLDAIKYDPRRFDAYYQLALLLQNRPELCDQSIATEETENGNGSEATKPKTFEHTPGSVMAEMLEKNPDSAKAHYYMSIYLMSQKGTIENRKEAFQYAEKALGLAPDDRDALFLTARCALESGNLEQACKYAQQGLDQEKESDRFRNEMYKVLADTQYRLKNREKALEALQKGFQETKDPAFLWHQTDWQIDANEIERAQESLKQLTSLHYETRALEYLRGKIQLTKFNWGEASRAFESARPYFTNRPDQAKQIEFWLGNCYGRLGNSDQQILCYQKALNIDPSFQPATVALAQVKAQAPRGEIILSLPQIVEVIKSTKDPRVLSSMIQMAIATINAKPKESQNWKELEGILDEVQKNFPDIEEMPLYRCELMMAQGQNEEAEKLLRGLVEKNSKSAQYWRALAIVFTNQKKFDEAEKTFALFEKALGDTLEYRMTKANYFVRRYGKDALPRLKELVENTDAFDDQQKTALWGGLLSYMREIGAREEIRNLVRLMAERDPNNIQYLIMSFDQANEAGDEKRMEKISSDIEKIEGNGPFWLYTQAVLRIRKVRAGSDPNLIEEALVLLDKAKEKRSNWAKIPLLRGQIFDLKKDPSRALQFYQEGIGMGDYNIYALLRVMQILHEQQRFREANELFHRMEREQIQIPVELTKAWVSLLLNKEVRDYETALDKARKVAAAKTDDYKDALWYGNVLGEINRSTLSANRKKVFEGLIPEQERAFRRAVELNPSAPEVWVTLINFLVSIDKLSEAETTLDEARKKFTDKEGQIALAQCLEVLKRYEQAKEQYRLVLAANPQDAVVTRRVAEFFIRMSGVNKADRVNDLKQAETLLNRIIEGKEVKGEKEDLLWARRSTAWLMQARYGYENIEQARKLVELNLKENPDSVPDLSLLAFINFRDPKQSNREAALKVYKKLQADQKASEDDLYKLAQLYLSNGNWNAASELLRELAIGANEDPKYPSLYIRELLDHGEVSDAETYLPQVQEKWPNHISTILLQAELLIRSNKAEEALDMMKSFVDRPNAYPADRDQRVRLMAAAMEDFVSRVLSVEQAVDSDRFIRTAEAFLRRYADDHPSSSMDVVGFLARQRRFDDAADMLDQNWKTTDPVSLHQACMIATEAGRGEKGVVDRVEKILVEAKTQFNNNPTILLAIGDLKVGEGQYQEAEEIYRNILKDNPGHTVAMNNLAVLLTVSRNNLPEALEMINKAIGITGPQSQMLDTRACVYIALGKADKALSDMKDVLLDSKRPESLFHQAQALDLAGRDNAAAVAMQEALQMGLSEKQLLKPEIPTFQRLRDRAHALSPLKKIEKTPNK